MAADSSQPRKLSSSIDAQLQSRLDMVSDDSIVAICDENQKPVWKSP